MSELPDMAASTRGKINLVNIAVTAFVMVAVTWSYNRLADTFFATDRIETRLDESKEFRAQAMKARDREIDDIKRDMQLVKETLLKGCKQ